MDTKSDQIAEEDNDSYVRELQDLVGGRIKSVRKMTPNEVAQMGWTPSWGETPVIVLVEKEGVTHEVIPSRDAEANGPGVLRLL